MNELLPIVRRVRRPLVGTDVPPVVVGIVEPVNATAATTPAVEPQEGAGEPKRTEPTNE